MSQMKSFEGSEEMYDHLVKFAVSDEFTQENYLEPNWGVSPEFLLEALENAKEAENARWMKPIIFITGITTGMISGALLNLESPIYWLTF